MKMADWLSRLKNAKKSCLMDNNLKKIHYDFGDGQEMVEEYNLDTNVVTRRAWKVKKGLESEGEWDIEIGDPEPNYHKEDDNNLIKESPNQPIVSRRITKSNLEWRIRNLPYPIETYSVKVDEDSQCLIVKTSNKKYYKKLPIPDLNRLNINVRQENISFSHKFNTLVIVYKKPKQLIEFERELLKELQQVKPKMQEDMNCRPS